MRRIIPRFVIVTALALLPGGARASTVFVAHLDGAQEVPHNVSTGTGTAVVTLNDAMTQISVTLNWQDLLAGATAADIHKGAPGTTGPILFSLALGSGAGTTTGSIDPTPQTFAITPAQVADLKADLDYVEVSTSSIPAGEIRGQLALVPEPSSLVPGGVAAVVGILGYGWRLRARRA
jgi:hypothetical protein